MKIVHQPRWDSSKSKHDHLVGRSEKKVELAGTEISAGVRLNMGDARSLVRLKIFPHEGRSYVDQETRESPWQVPGTKARNQSKLKLSRLDDRSYGISVDS
jgi:hypothetical protein